MRQASEAAFIKLLAALPSLSRRDAEYVHQRIHIDATGWHHTEEDVSCLPTLQEAIWQERKLSLKYQRGDSATVERLVDPLGLVAKGSTWYLVAAVEGEVRTYRVSRMLEAGVTDGYLLSFGTQVEIVEPPALREKIIELAESVVAFYQSNLSTRNARL